MQDENTRLKVEILLQEFSNREQKLISRYSAQFQAIGALAVILAGLIAAFAAHVGTFIIGLIIFANLVFLAVFLWADNDISKAAARMREIETAINSLVGEELLVWENKRAWGGGLVQIICNALSRK